MKVLKIIAISLLCTLTFSSCNKNYSKLIEGKWRTKGDVSYLIEKGKRNYFSDDKKGEITVQLSFNDGNVLLESGHVVNNVFNIEERKQANYHIDKGYIYCDGVAIPIVKVNNKTMIWERNDDEYDSFHVEFTRMDDRIVRSFILNIWYSVPIWIWLIIGIILAIFIIGGWDDGGETVFWILCAIMFIIWQICII